jgi:hypothetical protein
MYAASGRDILIFMPSGGKREGAGKPKGYKAPHTLEASALRQSLIAKYAEKSDKVNDALIRKALMGDVPAIKELHDRVYGKANQYLEVAGKDGKDLVAPTPGMVELARQLEEMRRKA